MLADAERRASQTLSSLASGERRLDDIPACEDAQQPASIVDHWQPTDLQCGRALLS